MSAFRIRYETKGKHTHLRLFSSRSGDDGTWQLAGRLRFRNDEFAEFKLHFEACVEFKPEQWEEVRQNLPIEEPRDA